MCTAHGERTIITVRYQTEYVEHKLDEQTDSHSGHSAHAHDWTIPGLLFRWKQDCPDQVHNLVPI